MQQMDRVFQGLKKTGEKEIAPSFSGIVSAERVLTYISSRIKLDLAKGYASISGGDYPLPEDSVVYFSQLPVPEYDTSRPSSLALVESRMALEIGLKCRPTENQVCVERRARVLAAVKSVVTGAINKIEEEDLMKRKCQICERSFHKVTRGVQETNCPQFNAGALCFKCGSDAAEFCYGGLRGDRRCVKQSNLDCNECPDQPRHAKTVHEVTKAENILLVKK